MGTTIAGQLADYAKALRFKDLPTDVVHQAKRCLIDTLACAFGGYGGESSRIIQSALGELGGQSESTVIGSGVKTSCLNATLVNGLMVRYLDYNDYYRNPEERMKSGFHPSEVIPAVLALGERQGSSGQDAIVAIVLGYELVNRFMDFFSEMEVALVHKGWNGDCRGAFAMPLVAGKLLGLTVEQMENAVGISGSHGMVLGILDAAGEEYTMTKSLRFPFTAFGGIQAAILAWKGFTGPTRVIEGNGGFMRVVMGGSYDTDTLTKGGKTFRIMHTGFKPYSCEGTNHGHVTATLELVRKHDIKPEDVDHVTIRACTYTAEHCGDPVKRHPHNKETADHSAHYLTAIAIVDRAVGPDQFLPERISDPKVYELIDKVTVEALPELDALRDAGISEITTKAGQTYRHRVDNPKGHPVNPLTDAEIEAKLRSTASKYMNPKQMGKLISIVHGLDTLRNVKDLMELTVFSPKLAMLS